VQSRNTTPEFGGEQKRVITSKKKSLGKQEEEEVLRQKICKIDCLLGINCLYVDGETDAHPADAQKTQKRPDERR